MVLLFVAHLEAYWKFQHHLQTESWFNQNAVDKLALNKSI